MDVKLSEALTKARIALGDASEKAAKRRLLVYGEEVPCGPGCAGCCKRLVTATVAEALFVYDHLERSGVWPEVAVECRRQFRDVRQANFVSWLLQGRDCPVLDPATKRCRAYPVRPAACSTHFVASDPRLCDPSYSGPGKYVPVDFEDLFESFRTGLGDSVESFGILTVVLPLQQALLLAERINLQSGLSPDKVLALFLYELR